MTLEIGICKSEVSVQDFECFFGQFGDLCQHTWRMMVKNGSQALRWLTKDFEDGSKLVELFSCHLQSCALVLGDTRLGMHIMIPALWYHNPIWYMSQVTWIFPPNSVVSHCGIRWMSANFSAEHVCPVCRLTAKRKYCRTLSLDRKSCERGVRTSNGSRSTSNLRT